ncbi:zinc-binding dehydrogenase [Pedobacter immunditicola]|uniref:zinc-binding dehydrogenase n=1 Tax=Pedobacter immunditicola TaxID=3133440 RepID=UPI00309B79FF
MFQTVYGSLHLALKIKEGETLLIRGGTSSIGMLATQIAKSAGLQVIATTRNKDKQQLLLDNGADEVIIDDGKLEDKLKVIRPQGVDKVLELVGTATLPDSLRCASLGGMVCMTGMLSEQWSLNDFAPMDVIPATVCLTVYDSGQVRVGQQYYQQFVKEVEAGNVHLNINRSFVLDEISQAHRFMETNSGAGKIVVLP